MDGYVPNRIAEQAHHHPARAILLTGGVRGGKSLASAMEVVSWVPHSNLIWLAAIDYDQTRQEFEYAEEALLSLEFTNKKMVSKPKNRYNPCSMNTIFGSRIETRSLKDLATFAGRAPDLVVLCEPGQAPPGTLSKARERLSTRRGRLWAAGTFEDIPQSWIEDTWKRWVRYPNADGGKSFAMPTWLNTRSFPEGRHDPEIIALEHSYPNQMEFLLRCAGIPVASSALVIGDYFNHRKHVNDNVMYRPVHNGAPLPVELAIDPGYSGGSHYTVEAVQHIGNTKFIVDEVCVQGMVHEEVINICKNRPWWQNVHKMNGGTMDPYAGDSHWYGSLSPMEVWHRIGGVQLRLPPRLSVEDTVSLLCTEMRNPENHHSNIVISPKCARLIWEMGHWRKKRNQSAGMAEPTKHNCDAIKALGYYLADRQYARLAGGKRTDVRVEEISFV